MEAMQKWISRSQVITRINLDGRTLAYNLITSYQVDYPSSSLIPAKAVENDQTHLLVTDRTQYHIISLVTLWA